MVVVGLKLDTWVQTLIPLMSMAGQVPSPGPRASPFGKGEGGPIQSEVLNEGQPKRAGATQAPARRATGSAGRRRKVGQHWAQWVPGLGTAG